MSDHYDRYKGMEELLSTNLASLGTDCISRQAAMDALNKLKIYRPLDSDRYVISDCLNKIVNLPSAQPETHEERTETHACDLISRQAALDVLEEQIAYCDKALKTFEISMKDEYAVKVEKASLVAYKEQLEAIPAVQPERTCVNCGRTVNNGGWYADGRTRCPIEEHYALPKDGYCHLWEKRNVTDDDYPERREE